MLFSYYTNIKEPSVPRNFVRLLCIVLFSLSVMAYGQDEFSADLYNADPGKNPAAQAKIYMAKNKVRIEPQQHSGPGGLVIFNFSTQITDVLVPERKMYMEFASGQGPQQRAFSYFRPSDVQNACGDWQKLATNRGGTCKKVGNETVNGRDTVKYEGMQTDGSTSYVWLDPALRFPVKWQGKNSGGELRNISVGSQPSSLFEVPAGYQKMEMGGVGMPPNMQHP
jgi:hypothetical protein